MKKRIIAMLLLVATVVSLLAGCAYSYVGEEDYTKYVTVDKAKLEELFKNIKIADGDFTTDEDVRDAKVWDTIYETLAGKADKDAKLTEGKVGAHDILYYCYYATVNNDAGEPVVIFASKMQESSATKLQLGISDNEGVAAIIGAKLANFDFKDNAYKTVTAGKAKDGATAYITYTVEYKETVDGSEKTKTTTYTYKKVTIGDENHPVAKKLKDYDIATTFKDSANDNKTTFTDGEKTYSNIKINWVVDGGEELSFTDTTYTAATSEKAVDGTSMALKDKVLTYHVFPVYYLSVAEFSAAELLKNVFATLSVSTLPSFEGEEDAIKAFNDLKTALADAKSKTETAEKNVETAETALEKAEAAVKDDKPTEAQQTTIDAAKKSLEDNKKALDEAKKAEEEAVKKLDAGVTKFYESVRADIIENEYKDNIYKGLVNEYNNEIRNNLAEAIWKAMKENSKVNDLPENAVKSVYDRLMEKHRYDFATGTYDSTKKISNYKQFKGNFDNYLKYKKGVGDADVSKATEKVMTEAKEYVTDIFVVFAVAEAFGQKLTKADMKAFREDVNSSYSYYEYTYGEANVEAAAQFDKLMDYYLEWNTEGKEADETVIYVNGKLDFVRVNYTISDGAAEETPEETPGEEDPDHDHDH